MPTGRRGPRSLPALLIATAVLLGSVGGLAAQSEPTPVTVEAQATPADSPAALAPTGLQPSSDALRVAQDGQLLPYRVLAEPPALVTTPDGGAWAFFTARARRPEAVGAWRLYGARFDPRSKVWLPAEALPGGQIQYLPAAVVDSVGTVHVVYSDRASDAADAVSVLVYTRSNGTGGWETPVSVAPDPNAGHQMMASLALDGEDHLHVIWRDQRAVAPEQRAASAGFGDLFVSDYVDGGWSTPTQVYERATPDVNAGYPFLAVDGDRLVAVWSVYRGTTREELERPAARVEWSTRPLRDPVRWANPKTLIERGDGEVGGFLVDVATDPRGGLAMAYGRLFRAGDQTSNDVFLRRLDAGAEEWGADARLTSGDRGYVPSVAVGADGTTYVVFNSGRDNAAEVGAVLIPSGSAPPTSPIVLTQDQSGVQARGTVVIGADGQPWVLYLHANVSNPNETEVRCLRGARLSA